jgi:hypothetical protein
MPRLDIYIAVSSLPVSPDRSLEKGGIDDHRRHPCAHILAQGRAGHFCAEVAESDLLELVRLHPVMIHALLQPLDSGGYHAGLQGIKGARRMRDAEEKVHLFSLDASGRPQEA